MRNGLYFLLLTIIVLRLGSFLDITNNPKKVDIIVILGGGKDIRTRKGAELYTRGFSKYNQIIVTGANLHHDKSQKFYKIQYLLDNGIKRDNIFHISDELVTNTMEELFEIKKYLVKKKYNSALIVTHPSHSKRTELLANLIAKYNSSNIDLSFVSADETKLWDKNFYFLNKESILLVISEILKIPFNLIKYFNHLL